MNFKRAYFYKQLFNILPKFVIKFTFPWQWIKKYEGEDFLLK